MIMLRNNKINIFKTVLNKSLIELIENIRMKIHINIKKIKELYILFVINLIWYLVWDLNKNFYPINREFFCFLYY